jgi:hypothetical protein
MKAPPVAPNDVPTYALAKLHPDHHLNFGRALYSAPHAYLRKQLRVRGDSKLVKIYFGTELIKTHPRRPPGGRVTDPNDYPPGKSVTRCARSTPSWRVRASEVTTSARSRSACSPGLCLGHGCDRSMRCSGFATSTAMGVSRPFAKARSHST